MKNENINEMLVIAVGAYAGGINTLKGFFSNYQPIHSSVVITQHMDTSSLVILKEVVEQFSKLIIEEISDGLKIRGGRIYTCPPSKFVSIEKDTFILQELPDSPQKYSTIDFFMNSLAVSFKERAVGVLLSGEGMDGVMGLKTISDNGGLTFAQNEESAENPNMPKCAIDLGFVDYVVAPDVIGSELYKYEEYLAKLVKSTTLSQLKEEIGAAIISICDILHKHTHHDFKHYKTSTIIRRIQRRMSVLHIDKVDEYVNSLGTDKNERNALFNDLLINVTSFFRDPEAFEALKTEVLIPDLKKFTGSKKYRIWVAGCSTGEEPYTLAMLIREVMDECQLKFDVQIIATDIDEEALNIARRGDYPLSIADKISPQRLEKFFTRKNGRFSVSKQLREMILFSSHNLINDPPFSQVDLITCRNVLIYLGPHLQKKLIPVFHYAIKPNGHLFLGTSEALTSHKDLFNAINAKYRIAQRKATAIHAPAQSFFTALTTSYSAHFKEAPQSHEEDLHLIGQRILLDEFSPKFAIISDECKIVSVSAGIQEFLEPSEGSFQNNILKLVRPNLRSPLRLSINEAKKEKRQIQNQVAILRMDSGLRKIGIVVQPMPQLGEHTGLYMVVFRDFGAISEDASPHATSDKVDLTMVEELEKELAKLRDELERSVQDLEASNEELKSSNEELLSMNEELQSANEELEVSKEEVQKGNEVLTNSNIDLENLLHSTKIATIFLDQDLNIKNFTPAATELYDLVPHDIGRSIKSFSSKAKKMPPYSYPKDLKVDQVVETEVIMPDGRIFLRRKSPYVNQKKEMVGLVITFVDVTEVRRSEMLFRSLANTVPQMVFSTDAHGNYNYFSDQWTTYTGLDTKEVENKGFREIIHPDDKTGVIEAWTTALENADTFTYQYRLKNKHGQYRWHLLGARSLKDHLGNIYQWFGGCTDIQDQKEMELKLHEQNKDIMRTQERFNGVARAINLGVWYCNLPFDVLNWSDNVKTQFWCDLDEVITINTFYDRMHPEDRKSTEAAINDSIENHKHYDTNFRTVDPKTGAYKWIRAIGWTDYDEDKRPIRFDGVTFDITESTIYMNALRDSEWRYSMASKAAREVIWDWNLVTNEVHWNEALVSQFGYEEEYRNTNAQWWIDHVHPEDRSRITDSIHHCIEMAKPYWKDEYRFLKENGEYAMVMDQGYIQMDDKKAIRMIGTMYDVTEQNRYLVEMKEAVRARDEFLSIASHELKTPLTSMILQMQMLQRKIDRGTGDLPQVVDANKLLLKQCRLLTSLIDDMLDVSRIANGKMNFNFHKESLKSMVMTSLDSFSINIEEKNIKINVDIEDDVLVLADPFRLEQVVSNLLSNAIKYGQGQPIKISIGSENSCGVIKVEDSGLGISSENIEKIFNLFERAISSVNISGLGLGLYISKQIVSAHGGDIHVESELGKGSIFKVLIPMA
jgi:two-component system CheB/CheR fusion protein